MVAPMPAINAATVGTALHGEGCSQSGCRGLSATGVGLFNAWQKFTCGDERSMMISACPFGNPGST